MKKLLRDAWRAVTGNNSDDSQLPRSADSAAVDKAFQAALDAHQAGHFSEAQLAYSRILDQIPDHAPSLHFLGVIHSQTGDLVRAERLIRESIELQSLPEYYSNLAMVLERQGRHDEAIAATRDAVRQAPDQAAPLVALGDRLFAARRMVEAEDAYRNALQLRPEDADLWFRFGVILSILRRGADAAEAYRRTLALKPDNVEACNNLGLLLVGMESAGEAEAAYRSALELQPDYADAHNNLGVLLQGQGRAAEAEAAYRGATAANPDFMRAWSNLGLLLEDQARFADAETAHLRALSLEFDNATVHFNLANIYGKSNRNAEAESAYRRALELRPDYPEAWANLAALLHGGGRLEEAESFFRRALALDPQSAAVHYNLGGLLLDNGRQAEAEALLDRALVLQPDLADAHNRAGTLYKETGRPIQSEAAYRQALRLRPDSTGTLTNLALLMHETERFAEAEEIYHQVLELDPAHDFAHYNLSLLRLSQKRFQEGWSGYEHRWKMKGFNALRHQARQMPWQGESLSGETLVVWQEQGVGDVILYAGMISDLIAKGVHLIVECEARLVTLFSRSFPQAQVVARSDHVHPLIAEAHWQSPLGSLCRWLRRRPEDFTWRGPYLVPDAARVGELRKRYRGSGAGLVIGISWRSGNYKVGARKSLPLSAWVPLLKSPGATFVNLQYGDCREELARLERDHGITVLQDKDVDALKDLDGFSAQVAAMDLVISTSNSTVHFAGAMGIPVWTLLPRGDALLWYWFRETEQSLWYPGMRLFRQGRAGDWTGLLEKVQAALPEFIAEREKNQIAETRTLR